MLLRIALEHTRADQVGRVIHGMHERLGVVDDEPACGALFQPGHEMLARWLRPMTEA
jgi:hypothetical protein